MKIESLREVKANLSRIVKDLSSERSVVITKSGTGKTVLRNYINATVGFDKLATVTKKSPKSLMRMLGPKGNPQARNFFEIVAYLQKREGVRLKVRAA